MLPIVVGVMHILKGKRDEKMDNIKDLGADHVKLLEMIRE